MRELFIYFRAQAQDDALVKSAVHAMQDQLRQVWPGLNTRLLHRPQVQDGLRTWMEVYSMRGDEGVSIAVQSAIEHAADNMAPLLMGIRHVEVFVDGS